MESIEQEVWYSVPVMNSYSEEIERRVIGLTNKEGLAYEPVTRYLIGILDTPDMCIRKAKMTDEHYTHQDSSELEFFVMSRDLIEKNEASPEEIQQTLIAMEQKEDAILAINKYKRERMAEAEANAAKAKVMVKK